MEYRGLACFDGDMKWMGVHMTDVTAKTAAPLFLTWVIGGCCVGGWGGAACGENDSCFGLVLVLKQKKREIWGLSEGSLQKTFHY